MLHYAEFININNSNIDVPISSLFKYLKYLKKYLFLHIIIKFYNKTLTKEYNLTTSKLLTFINNKLIKKITIKEYENSPKNIEYKKIINEFHQNFFINQKMFPEFKVLNEVVNDYNYIKEYINKSRFLFKDLFLNNYYNKENNEKIICPKSNNLNVLKFLFNKEQINEKHNENNNLNNLNNLNYLNNKNNKNNKNKKYKTIRTLKGGKINTYKKIINKSKNKTKKCKTKCCFKNESIILYNDNHNDNNNDDNYDINNEFDELKKNIKESFIKLKNDKTGYKNKKTQQTNNLKYYEINEIKKELKKSFNDDINYLNNLTI